MLWPHRVCWGIPFPFHPTSSVPSPYHRPTIAATSSDFVLKSEDAVAMVLSWYGVGTAMVGIICGHGGSDGRA